MVETKTGRTRNARLFMPQNEGVIVEKEFKISIN